ncbi:MULTISPECIES: hypothetical protein [Streptomyces]|uniref:Lipoprotein n=1 Tax=Streptomyces xanthii TaxID=2768069 RepID=A0A7H1B5Y0_9ACTN|nr:hypothetical protein [Streptomyces xanthii]QNS04135.1 hypothetical protein IAG42_11195 [Streptomyces xanthii]
MTSRRPGSAARTVPAAVLLLIGAAALTGCGDAGGLESAGATPTAVGPRTLWPKLPPATRPADDYGAGETAVVKGVDVPGGDLRKVDPLAVVRARMHADRKDYDDVVDRLDACGPVGPGGSGASGCPVLRAYYPDLTGDGKPDLLVAVRAPKRQLYTQVYVYRGGRLTQIMDDKDAVINVQLAGRILVVRAAADLPGYEYRTSWSYDSHQEAMLPTRDEIIRTGPPGTPTASPSGTSSAVPSPSPYPSRS